MKKVIILAEIIIIILLLNTTNNCKVFLPTMPPTYVEAKKEAQPRKYFILKTTGYCPCEKCCGEWADGLTYTGDKAGRGSIAIDPKAGILRLGQRVLVEGYGFGVCNDKGGAIKGWEADLCFDSHERAKEWGVKLVKVYVLD